VLGDVDGLTMPYSCQHLAGTVTQLSQANRMCFRNHAAKCITFLCSHSEPGRRVDQESRSTRHQAATSLVAMDITIQSSFLPQNDPEAAVAFYRDVLGFEVRNDVGYGGMHWITVGPASQPGTSIVLFPPEATPGITDDERRTIAEMMAKGSYGIVVLATKDLDGTFARLQASDAEVVQEPTEQPYGIRDCAFRDPAGNMIRISEVR